MHRLSASESEDYTVSSCALAIAWLEVKGSTSCPGGPGLGEKELDHLPPKIGQSRRDKALGFPNVGAPVSEARSQHDPHRPKQSCMSLRHGPLRTVQHTDCHWMI
jgi:hypothetical protein